MVLTISFAKTYISITIRIPQKLIHKCIFTFFAGDLTLQPVVQCVGKECGASCGTGEHIGACDSDGQCTTNYEHLNCEIDIMSLPISARGCCVDGRGCCTRYTGDSPVHPLCVGKECGAGCETGDYLGACDSDGQCTTNYGKLECEINIMSLPILYLIHI